MCIHGSAQLLSRAKTGAPDSTPTKQGSPKTYVPASYGGPEPAVRGGVAVMITDAANTLFFTSSPPGPFLVLKKKVAMLLSLSHQPHVFLLLLMKAKAFFNWLLLQQPADNAHGATSTFSRPRPAGHSGKHRWRPAAHSLPGPLKAVGGKFRVHPREAASCVSYLWRWGGARTVGWGGLLRAGH